MVTDAELKTMEITYKNSNKILFGKILEKYLKNPVSEFGFFQNALLSAIPEFFMKVFSYRQRYGFAITGTTTTTSVPPVVSPVLGSPGGVAGTTACIVSFIPPILTIAEINKACKDQGVGYWGRIFELMAKYVMNTTVTICDPVAFGLTYTTTFRSVYPALQQTWLAAGIAFGKKMQAKQVDNHDYAMKMWSDELNKQIRAMTGVIALPAYPVIAAIFSGSITCTWADFNTMV